jgi:hypothetical protein
MNAKKFLFVLVPALLIFSGCGQAPAGTPGSAPGAAGSGEESMKSTPIEVLKSGKSLECTYTGESTEQGVKVTGNYYVDGSQGKFRMDGQANVSGQQISTTMIGDKDYIYTWSDVGGKTGFKMAVPKTTEADKGSADQADATGVEAKMDFKCHSWSPDAAKFALPTDVKFLDFGGMK